jgi:hypothetical protein
MRDWEKTFSKRPYEKYSLDTRHFKEGEIYEHDETGELITATKESAEYNFRSNDTWAISIFTGKKFIIEKRFYHKLGDLSYKKSVDWTKPLEIRIFDKDYSYNLNWTKVEEIVYHLEKYCVSFRDKKKDKSCWYFNEDGFARRDGRIFAEVRNIEKKLILNGDSVDDVWEIITKPLPRTWGEVYTYGFNSNESLWKKASISGTGIVDEETKNYLLNKLGSHKSNIAKIKFEKQGAKYKILEFKNFLSEEEIVNKYGKEIAYHYIYANTKNMLIYKGKLYIYKDKDCISMLKLSINDIISESEKEELLKLARECGNNLSRIIKEHNKKQIITEEI